MKITTPFCAAKFVALLMAAGLVSLNAACSSPKDTEETPSDATRVSDVMRISYEIALFKVRNGRIPTDLAEITRDGQWTIPGDPAGGRAYEYKALDGNRYELCTTFDKAIEPRQGEVPGIIYGDGLAHGYGYWVHGGGRQCAQRTLQ